ncbi:histidine kinase [Spirillospora sp. NPDC047279]|uniref:histidine kinase n=1 Tax=Spirillospora sp. NPDC047279 TaxID=3155478 RepID=UPI003400E3A8
MELRRTRREWATDAAVTVVAAVVGLLMLGASMSSFEEGKQAYLVNDLVVGAVACGLLLLLRRTWPVGLAVVLMITQIFASTAYGPAALAVFTVAVNRSWLVTAAVAAANLGVITVVFSLVPLDPTEYREGLVTFYSGYAVLVSVGLLIRSQRLLIRSLRERAREAEEGQRLRVEEARLLERERIAREMHDVLAHRISLLSVHAGALEFSADVPPAQREAAGVIRQSAYEAMEDLREVIGVLRGDGELTTEARAPGERDRPQPTLTDLPALIDQSREAGAHVTLDARIADPDAVPARIGRHAYRVVQEGLTNARKHAPGAHVRVIVETPHEDELTIDIVNRLPPGLPPLGLPGAGAGLVGLKERVALVGGTIEHGRTSDVYRLHVALPLPERSVE